MVLCHIWLKGYMHSYRQLSAQMCHKWHTIELIFWHRFITFATSGYVPYEIFIIHRTPYIHKGVTIFTQVEVRNL